MTEIIIEFFRVAPSVCILVLIIIAIFKYSKQIDKIINKVADSSVSRVDLFGAKLDFVVAFEDKNKVEERSHKSISLPYNSYALLKRIDFVLNQNIKMNVLWIEDNEIKIINQKKRLTELGMSIKHVESSEAALKELVNNKKPYQLIISEMKMRMRGMILSRVLLNSII